MKSVILARASRARSQADVSGFALRTKSVAPPAQAIVACRHENAKLVNLLGRSLDASGGGTPDRSNQRSRDGRSLSPAPCDQLLHKPGIQNLKLDARVAIPEAISLPPPGRGAQQRYPRRQQRRSLQTMPDLQQAVLERAKAASRKDPQDVWGGLVAHSQNGFLDRGRRALDNLHSSHAALVRDF
eukprot:scaffold140_cov247-Pinguiococcus_pyrenoidosus.AAC.28